jgi:uncharacterized protein YerC
MLAGHSQRVIAEASGCSQMTVSNVTRALNNHYSTGENYHDAYQAICDAANAPKTPKPSADVSSEATVTP